MRTFLFYFACFYCVVSTFTMIFTYVIMVPIHWVVFRSYHLRWRIKVHFLPFDFWIGFFCDRKKKVLWVCPLPMVAIRIWQEEKI